MRTPFPAPGPVLALVRYGNSGGVLLRNLKARRAVWVDPEDVPKCHQGEPDEFTLGSLWSEYAPFSQPDIDL